MGATLSLAAVNRRVVWVRTYGDLYYDAEGHLSKLVNLRTVQKPISDARTATYVILSTGSGPGG